MCSIVIFYIIINLVCIGFTYIIPAVKSFLSEYSKRQKRRKNICFSTKGKLFIKLMQ